MDTEREGSTEAVPEPEVQVRSVEQRLEPVGPATGDTLCQELV